MKEAFLLFIILIQFVFSSCKQTEKTALNKSDSQKIQAQEKMITDSSISSVQISDAVNNFKKQQEINSDSLKYDLVVSFYSIGSGIDRTTLKAYFLLLNEYKENYSDWFSFERVPWGREGEVDFCIHFFNPMAKEVEIFKNKSHEILKNSKLVHSNENAECNKRRH